MFNLVENGLTSSPSEIVKKTSGFLMISQGGQKTWKQWSRTSQDAKKPKFSRTAFVFSRNVFSKNSTKKVEKEI